jgi:hypothetical protein
MGIQEKSLLIRHPSVLRNLISMCLVIFSMTITSRSNHNHDFSFYFPIIWSIIIFMIFVFLLIRLFRVKNITIGDNFIISINKKKYDADQIRLVIIDGKRIGIKVFGKKLVPLDLYFTFKKEDAINGMEEIKWWAKRNNISIKYKFFWGWV